VTAASERGSALLSARLASHARQLTGSEPAVGPILVGDGAALIDEDAGRIVFLASPDNPAAAFGHLVLLAARHRLNEAVVIYDDPSAAAVATRRSAAFDPVPTIQLAEGTVLHQVDLAPLPEPPPTTAPPPGFVDLCRQAGVNPIQEGGIWRGELLGLEVARATPSGIEIGVGRIDREAGVVLHGHRPPAESLMSVVATVQAQRRSGAGAHPLATLVRERWLRSDLITDPSPLGLVSLTAVDPAETPAGLRDSVPAAAIGIDASGERVLVVCSVGADPDLVPVVADLVLREDPDRLLVVLPVRDVLPTVVCAVGRLAVRSEVVGLRGGWS
jgi:hypothetical protein|tara:strand:- start:16974 stop:17963 length:990 start_codon:yes stop_codon:yes gene_type:complete